MGWIIWFFGNRNGTAVPILFLGGGLLGAVIANSVPIPWPTSALIGAVLGALATAGSTFLVARSNRSRSGEVRYDAQGDHPVVVGENSGTFVFIPVMAWVFLGAGLAFWMALGWAEYGHQQARIMNAPEPAVAAASLTPAS